MRRLALVGLALGLLVAVAGCGGQTTYTLKNTENCLAERGAHNGGKLDDFVASTAPGGAFVTHLSDNWATVVFGSTLNDGKQIELAYQRFALPNVRAGLPDVLRRYANTVTLWHQHPNDSDLSLVVGCLK